MISVVVLIRVVLVVCKIMVGYLEGTSEHEEWFEGGRQSVCKERLFGVEGFPVLLSLLVLLYSKASTTLTQPWFLLCLDSLDTNFEASDSDYALISLLPTSPTSNPAHYMFGPCSGILITKFFQEIPEQTTSRCSISRTVQTNALVQHGGFPLQAARSWSRSSGHTPAAWYISSWRSFTAIPLYLHPIGCCFLFLLLPVLRTIFNWASSVMSPVVAFAVSWWATWCLRCSSVSGGGVLEETPVVLLDFIPCSTCWGVCGAMICCSGSEEMMITKQSGKSWGRR